MQYIFSFASQFIIKFFNIFFILWNYLMYSTFNSLENKCLWIYEKLITDPLKTFYFIGPVWENKTPAQICFELTGVDSAWWNGTSDRIQECHALLSKKYISFEATVLCSLYFAALSFIVLYLLCRCCFLRPILSEIRRLSVTKFEQQKSYNFTQ